jgi:hypothetical protein
MHWRSRISLASKAISASEIFFFGAFVCLTLASPQSAAAQKAPETFSKPDFAPAMLEHMQKCAATRIMIAACSTLHE